MQREIEAPTIDHPRRNSQVFLTIFPIVVLLYHIFPSFSLRAYFPVLIPLTITIALLARRNWSRSAFNNYGVTLLLAYCSIALVAVLFSANLDVFAYRKALLPAVGLSIGVFSYRYSESDLFRLALVVFIIAILFGGLITGTSSNQSLSGVMSSNWSTESIYGVAMAGIAVTLVSRQRFGLAFFVFVLAIILAKRNSILAAALVTFIYFLLAIFIVDRQRILKSIRFLLPIATLCMILVSWKLVEIFEYVAFSFSGVTPEMVSTGRHALYVSIQDELATSSLFGFLFGHGTGSIERLIAASNHVNPNITLAHSEYFSLFYDFGLFGCVIFFCFMIRFAWKSVKNSPLLLFIIFISSVENYLVTSFILMIFLFMLSSETRSRVARDREM